MKVNLKVKCNLNINNLMTKLKWHGFVLDIQLFDVQFLFYLA